MVRKLGNRGLAVFHRFEQSEDIDAILAGKKSDEKPVRILAEYGCAKQDFSAKAWYFEWVSL